MSSRPIRGGGRLTVAAIAMTLTVTTGSAVAQGVITLRAGAITAGGAPSSGPGYSVTGAVGSGAAGTMPSGGSFSVGSGFVASVPPTRFGDVNCDNTVNSIDGLFVLQLDVGLRGTTAQCPPPTTGTMFTPQCNVSGDNACNSIDALFVLQCDVGIHNAFCP